MNLTGKRVVIYGAGISGLSAYELVREKGGRVVIYDDDPMKPHATNSIGVFDDADVIVLSPSVNQDKDFLIDAKLENKVVVSELELASSVCNAEQIAVTGTNGKTTTTMLIDHMFRSAHKNSHAVGNIGIAFSAIADKLDAMEIAVVETSSFQLESTTKFSPDVAILLNITPDHLERHTTMDKYIEAKAKIFLGQSECDTVIYNDDDKIIAKLVPDMVAKKIPFSMTHPVDGAYVSSNFICFKGKPIVELEEIDFDGKELENALACVCVGMSHGLNPYTIASALISFERPEYRRKETAKIDDIKIFNDSKATNVYSCLSAVESMDGNTILILGGAKRSENFSELFDNLNDNVKSIIAVGENARYIYDCAKIVGFGDISIANTLFEAVALGIETAKALNCSNLLFSPASKSFDTYSSYIDRGRKFDAVVDRLKKK